MLRRAWAVARLLAHTGGRAALDSSLGFYGGVLIAAVILFAGNGMDARSVTDEAARSPSLRVVLVLAWSLCVTPAARALVQSRAASLLRPLPTSTRLIVAWLLVGLWLVNLPWVVLWFRGADPLIGAGAVCTAMTLCCALSRPDWLHGDTLLGGAALGAFAFAPPTWVLVPAAVAAWIGVRRAWLRVAEPTAPGRHAVPRRGRLLAIGAALAVGVKRHSGASVARAAGLVLVGAAVGTLALRNNAADPTSAAELALLVWAPACWLAAATLAGPLLGCEARTAWLLRVTGESQVAGAVAAAGLLAGLGALGGGAYVATLMLQRAQGPSLPTVVAISAAGAAWAIVAAGVVRFCRRDGRDGSGALVGHLALGAASSWLVTRGPALTLAVSWASALAITAWAARRRDAEVAWRAT